MLIDTHCHFNHARFAEDIEETIVRAQASGVKKMIVVGFDMESSAQAVTLAETYQNVLYAAVAVHPHDARHWDDATEARLRELATHPAVVAIGEIGLDFHYDFSPREDQDHAFRAQIHLARDLKLPVIIHCREAYPETLTLLEEEGIRHLGGVMHCWAGSVTEAKQTVSLGMKLGIGGTLTFKNAEEVRASALAVPTEALLIETDAPYLAPMPYRGKRNEPAYVSLVAQRLAELRGLTLEEVAALTTANAYALFPKLRS